MTSTFYPGSPYQNKLRHLGKYPEFTNDSFCKGCEKLMLNGHEWKIISTIEFLILVTFHISIQIEKKILVHAVESFFMRKFLLGSICH